MLESSWTVALGGLTGTLESIEDVVNGRTHNTIRMGQFEQLEGIDGNGSWQRTLGGEVIRLDAPQTIAFARNQAWVVSRGYLRPGTARYRELGGREDGGRQLRGLEAIPDGGQAMELWFDDATRLARITQQLGAIRFVTDFSDWRDVEGLQLPFHAVIDRGDPRNLATLTMTSARLGPAVPESTFAPPVTDADRLRFAHGKSSELGFDLINGQIFVDARVDGQPVRMLLDTGGANLVTRAAAARLGLKVEGEMAMSGAGDHEVGFGFTHAKTLQVGDATLANPVLGVAALDGLSASQGEDIDGLIGYEMFSRVAVRIDYAACRLTLTAPSAFTPPAGATAVPFEIANHIPVVRGAIDGIAGRFWIDTGWRSSLTTMAKFTRDRALAARFHARFETMTGWGVGGPLRTWPVRIREVTLGSVTVHDVVGGLFTGDKSVLTDPDAAAIIGTGILSRFVVTFDYAGRKMYLEPGAAGTRETFDRSGLYLIRAAGGHALRVAAVTAGGPAERAGVHVDDQITAIDGASIDTRRLSHWRAQLRDQPPGTRVMLRIDRAGAARDLALQLAELVP
ncbi:MAG TPA: aspartyl protease family protein [Kofleriaceae bacterium]|nr:aspartyl protease family protein [Kofleriaceae bacterium]